jgi:hypothetical protein
MNNLWSVLIVDIGLQTAPLSPGVVLSKMFINILQDKMKINLMRQ